MHPINTVVQNSWSLPDTTEARTLWLYCWPMFAPFRLFLTDLARFNSTRELEDSRVYLKVKEDIDHVLSRVWQEDFALPSPANARTIRAFAGDGSAKSS